MRPARRALRRGRADRRWSSRSPTRDHTERMLRAAGARVRAAARRGRGAGRRSGSTRSGSTCPATSRRRRRSSSPRRCSPGSRLRLARRRRQPDRAPASSTCSSGWAPGSRSTTAPSSGGEPVADVEVEHAELVATEIEPDEVPRLIDELPLFALAASMARGDSVVRGAAELRAKETDRIETVTDALRAARRPHPRDATTASGAGRASAAARRHDRLRRRPPDRDARRGRRPRLARGRADRGRGGRSSIMLPRFFDLLESH